MADLSGRAAEVKKQAAQAVARHKQAAGEAVYEIWRLLGDQQDKVATITCDPELADAILQVYYEHGTQGADYELR
jgi:hypothetical protein